MNGFMWLLQLSLYAFKGVSSLHLVLLSNHFTELGYLCLMHAGYLFSDFRSLGNL